jgi:exonuclease III
MVHIFCWNYRGLNKPKSKTLLNELLLEHKIDIVGIQETKIKDFRHRILDTSSFTIDK